MVRYMCTHCKMFDGELMVQDLLVVEHVQECKKHLVCQGSDVHIVSMSDAGHMQVLCRSHIGIMQVICRSYICVYRCMCVMVVQWRYAHLVCRSYVGIMLAICRSYEGIIIM